MMLIRQLCIVIDDRIAAEYRDVIARPKFRIAPPRAAALLATLQFQASVTAAPWTHAPPPDPDDVMFLEVAIHATDHVLVTGNTRHYPASCRGPVKVLTPRDAWMRLRDMD
jgi:predicted nucleic acid-binding protein